MISEEYFRAVMAPSWTENELADCQRTLEVCRADLESAQATKDPASIAFASSRHGKVTAWLAEHEAALPALADAERAYGEAAQRLTAAADRDELGTTDPKVATANATALIVARAAESARRRALPGLREVAHRPIRAIQTFATNAESRAREKAIQSLERSVAVMFRAYVRHEAIPRADDAGRTSDGATAQWFSISEEIVRRNFLARLKDGERPEVTDQHWEPPTLHDLESCIAARRGGLEGARAAARAKLSTLDGVSP